MLLQMLFASVVEDKMERAIYLTPFSSRSLEDVLGKPSRLACISTRTEWPVIHGSRQFCCLNCNGTQH